MDEVCLLSKQLRSFETVIYVDKAIICAFFISEIGKVCVISLAYTDETQNRKNHSDCMYVKLFYRRNNWGKNFLGFISTADMNITR